MRRCAVGAGAAWVVAAILAGWPGHAIAQETSPADTVPESPAAVADTLIQAPPAFQAVQDSAATEQLQALFQRIEGLEEVSVEVDGGVATLRGRALTPEVRQTAVELAQGRDGVLYVEDHMEVETSLRARLGPVMARLREQAVGWVASIPLLLVGLVVVGVFGFLAGRIARWNALYRGLRTAPFAEGLARRGVWLLVLLVGVLLALELLDATALVGAILGAAGVAGIALGFAFRNIAENWLAGILLGMRRPFAPNDEVSIDGNLGTVVRLTPSDTVLMTLAGNHLRLPNAAVFNGVVENFTRNPLRRFTLTLTVPRDAPTAEARRVLSKGVVATPGVQADPPPQVTLAAVGDAHQTLEVHAWVDQRQVDFLGTCSLAYRRAKESLEEAGIPGPFAEHTIYRAAAEAPGSAVTWGNRPTPQAEADEEPAVDSSLERQVAEDRERSGEPDLLGGA